MPKRLTNVDTLSALLDRLICENIKLFFFVKENKLNDVIHQRDVVYNLKIRIAELFQECFETKGYDFLPEKRTWTTQFTESLEDLVHFDLHIGEGDRDKLKQVQSEDPSLSMLTMAEKRTRIANEGRASSKNRIDNLIRNIFSKWKRK